MEGDPALELMIREPLGPLKKTVGTVLDGAGQ